MADRFYAERVAFTTSTTGTGPIAVGSRLGPSFRIPSETNIANTNVPLLLVQEGDDYMICDASWSSSGSTLTVGTIYSSIVSGTAGTSQMSLAGNAEVRFLPPGANDLNTLFVRADKVQSLSASAQAQARSNISAPLAGHIFGLILSNNASDSVNDIDIAAGQAASTESNPVLMVLASGITKRLDASWAVGTNQGGLDTGSMSSNQTYHLWLIQRSDTGVVDVLFSLSGSSPTMPSNYDRKRRIGSIKTNGSTQIRTFYQNDDTFLWKSMPALDYDASNPGTSAVTVTMAGIPSGVVVEALLHAYLAINPADIAVAWFLSPLAIDDVAPSVAASPLGTVTINNATSSGHAQQVCVLTNASAQIRSRLSNSNGGVSVKVQVIGWIDRRGRNG